MTRLPSSERVIASTIICGILGFVGISCAAGAEVAFQDGETLNGFISLGISTILCFVIVVLFQWSTKPEKIDRWKNQ